MVDKLVAKEMAIRARPTPALETTIVSLWVVREAKNPEPSRPNHITSRNQEEEKTGLAVADRQLVFNGWQQWRENDPGDKVEKKNSCQEKYRSQNRQKICGLAAQRCAWMI